MFHYPNIRWTGLQAEAIGIPQVTGETLGVKEDELEDLSATIKKAKKDFGLEGLYTGALASVYQKSRVEKICEDAGLQCISPLWGIDPERHLRRLIDNGFVVVLVSVSALGLDQSWLGRTIDGGAIDELIELGKKFRFNVGLEGGEGETFVVDCPLFSKKVEIGKTAVHWKGDSGELEILDAKLVPKALHKA